jgi:hypothetical protein
MCITTSMVLHGLQKCLPIALRYATRLRNPKKGMFLNLALIVANVYG